MAVVNKPIPTTMVFLRLSDSRAPKKIPSRPSTMMAATLMRVLVIFYFLFPTVKMSLRGGLCRSNLVFYETFHSKGDCQSSTKWYTAKEQERRLAQRPLWGMTSIYEMYGREYFCQLSDRYSPCGKGGRDCMPNVCAARNVIARSS
jgi:hypothetical protein